MKMKITTQEGKMDICSLVDCDESCCDCPFYFFGESQMTRKDVEKLLEIYNKSHGE